MIFFLVLIQHLIANDCSSFDSIPGPISVHNRVDPTGKYIIVRTGLTSTSIMELPKKGKKLKMIEHESPLTYEPVGVEISHKLFLVASPGWGTGVAYYDFKDALTSGKSAKPLFEDTFGSAYESFGKIEGDENNFRIRVVGHPAIYRDYTVTRQNGKTEVKKSAVKILCPQFFTNPESWKESDWETLGPDSLKVLNLNPEFGGLPILSPDAQFFSVSTGKIPTTKIFRVVDGKCELYQDLRFATSKVSFGFSEGPTKDWIAFTATSTEGNKVYLKNLKTGQLVPIRIDRNPSGQSGANFSKDGRIFVRSSEYYEDRKSIFIYDLKKLTQCTKFSTGPADIVRPAVK